jgi:hypothetical protein
MKENRKSNSGLIDIDEDTGVEATDYDELMRAKAKK